MIISVSQGWPPCTLSHRCTSEKYNEFLIKKKESCDRNGYCNVKHLQQPHPISEDELSLTWMVETGSRNEEEIATFRSWRLKTDYNSVHANMDVPYFFLSILKICLRRKIAKYEVIFLLRLLICLQVHGSKRLRCHSEHPKATRSRLHQGRIWRIHCK